MQKVILLVLSGVILVMTASDYEQWCNTQGGGTTWYAPRQRCYRFFNPVPKWNRASAQANCQDNYNGYLAIVDTIDLVEHLKTEISIGANWIGLTQAPGSQEPDGGWQWSIPDGPSWDAQWIPWAGSHPVNINDAAILVLTSTTYYMESVNYAYGGTCICEIEPASTGSVEAPDTYQVTGQNQRHESGLLANVTLPAGDPTVSLLCSRKCNEMKYCVAFSSQYSTGECRLHHALDGIVPTTVSETGFETWVSVARLALL